MTAAAADPGPDPVVEFRRHLPTHAERGLHVTQTVVALIHAAVTNHGWTPQHLARECSRDIPANHANPGALVTHRLRKNASHPPPNAPARRGRPLCGRCENGLIYHVPDDPRADVTATKCECRTTTTSQKGHPA